MLQHKRFGKTALARLRFFTELRRPRFVAATIAATYSFLATSFPCYASREEFMTNFAPVSAAIGGALIGLSAVLLMLLNGRIAGVTGVFAGLIDPTSTDRGWRATFVAGMIIAPLSAALLGYTIPIPHMPASLVTVAVAGLLVGFGTRLGNGCTSGHGICGIARLSPRSITATAVFMAAAIVVVALTRHVIGG